MPRPIPIGISDFRSLREGGFYYVDKTALISETVDASTQVVLLPRPRRFGKTVNLSTLRWFFDRREEDLAPLFQDLAVWRSPSAREHFQRHPVLFLTFKDIKARTYDQCLAGLRQEITRACLDHAALAGDPALVDVQRRDFGRLLDGTASDWQFTDALRDVSHYLARAHGQPAIILIDEYDTPINAGFAHGYYDEIVGLLRNLLSGGLKDNRFLYKGVMTGVLRVAREGIFSGLNNVSVHSSLDPEFATAFGFTTDEVTRLLEDLGRADCLPEVQRWYDGYRFAGHVIYNPWSVLNYARTPDKGFRPYWVSTSAEDVLRPLERNDFDAADAARWAAHLGRTDAFQRCLARARNSARGECLALARGCPDRRSTSSEASASPRRGRKGRSCAR